MTRFVIIAAALAGCYKPAVGDCEYLCAADQSCPNELKCDPAMNRCREPALMGQACGAPPPDDGVNPDALCGWTYQPLNFNPCDLPANPTPLTIDTSGLVLDGDSGTFGGTAVPNIQTSDGMTIFHFSSIDVGPGLEIMTAGTRAIVIAVSGDISFAGIVAVDATGVSPGPGGGSTQAAGTRCNDSNGHDGTSQGGGGGAGFGQVGANGGTGNAGNFGTAGGTEMGFEPLRGGCNGGKGGNPGAVGNSTDGHGGGGGGAIQFSAKGTLLVNGGQIRAAGAGGKLGRDPAPSGGGGGGGSGGTIVLEGISVTVSNALLCANGGGGGGGGTVAGTMGSSGALGTCSNMPAAGGNAGGAMGGHGGGLVVPQVGGNGSEGAGGGGGGAGRIHFVGHPMMMVESSLITPPQS